MTFPRCWTYARISSRDQDQDENNESIPDQNRRTYRYFKENLEPEGVIFASAIEDRAVSAYKVPFNKRPGGKILIEQMRPGDHIIFDKVDRIWRSLTDFCRLMDWFDRRQIVVHIVSMQGISITSNTPMGKFMLGLLVQVAELESSIKSERNVNAAAKRREEGRRTGQIPLGMKQKKMYTKEGWKKFLFWDEDERRIMAHIVHLKDVEGLSFSEIAYQLSKDQAEAQGKDFNPDFLGKRPWSKFEVLVRYHRENEYREMERKGVTEAGVAQAKLHELAREKRRKRIMKRAAKATY